MIVPCKAPAPGLGALLADLAGQRTARAVEVLVVDAARCNGIAQIVRGGGARLVRPGTEGSAPCPALLPGAARNLGAAAARGRILAFVDADCRAAPGWVEAAAAALETGGRLVGGAVEDIAPHHPVARADNLLQFASLPATRPAGPQHYLPSCNMALRAGDFAALGGFVHPLGLATGEDVDLSRRAAELWGDCMRFAPEMVVRHAGRRSLPEFLRHHREFGYSRGRLGLLLSDRQARLGRRALLAPAVALRRLAYVVTSVARYSPARLPATLALSPLVLLGAGAWTAGFRAGLADAEADRARPVAPAALGARR